MLADDRSTRNEDMTLAISVTDHEEDLIVMFLKDVDRLLYNANSGLQHLQWDPSPR